jgi:hypothetical protein
VTRPRASQAEKRDELLFRIVQLRLQRGEYEKLAQAVLQMQNPEKAIEAMLDFAEESADDDNITQLLDVATAVTLQIGQPRPPVMAMPGMPAGMSGGPMPGMMPQGMPAPSMSMGGVGMTSSGTVMVTPANPGMTTFAPVFPAYSVSPHTPSVGTSTGSGSFVYFGHQPQEPEKK